MWRKRKARERCSYGEHVFSGWKSENKYCSYVGSERDSLHSTANEKLVLKLFPIAGVSKLKSGKNCLQNITVKGNLNQINFLLSDTNATWYILPQT